MGSELMAIRASEELKNDDVVFVGIGLPNLACNLARALHAPQLFMIYESGAIGAVPDRLPVSIGDPALVTNSLAIVGQSDIFQMYLQSGWIEVGFLGGAQVDRYGNINTTVIGSYEKPTIRLPGSGGACEIATHAKKLLIMMKMSPRSFVEKCDFVTSPGHCFVSKQALIDFHKFEDDVFNDFSCARSNDVRVINNRDKFTWKNRTDLKRSDTVNKRSTDAPLSSSRPAENAMCH